MNLIPSIAVPCTNPVVEILSQGDEVITGAVTDTNAAWLAQAVTPLGCRVRRHTAVGDRLEDIVAVLQETVARADIVLCSGGLGPTCDDLTAEAVSVAFALPLERDPVALESIRAFMTRRGRDFATCNEKQAWLPQGATRLDNAWGTAPGFTLRQGRCWLVFMPGVPREMQAMFEHRVKPVLQADYRLCPPRWTVFHTTGEGESGLQARCDRLNLPVDIRLGFLARESGVAVKLGFADAMDEACRGQWVQAVGEALGACVVRMDSESTGKPVGGADAAGGEGATEPAALTQGAGDFQFAAVAGQHVFDDGQSQT
jgi:molybdenum cofactor synthesis domain-containing protein